ncbi:hypothetical protein B6N60_02125 [Richelia sinica FACHB-800]|uniref:Uncharacterized protein n=1 Tax=Richelia sinica FACHB-800 TaxID=1357546 RepID=A0A975T7P2_9NOST|nr:hypothetical protein B6N60_02125 [Richelia sinica FACHB-800]
MWIICVVYSFFITMKITYFFDFPIKKSNYSQTYLALVGFTEPK